MTLVLVKTTFTVTKFTDEYYFTRMNIYYLDKYHTVIEVFYCTKNLYTPETGSDRKFGSFGLYNTYRTFFHLIHEPCVNLYVSVQCLQKKHQY